MEEERIEYEIPVDFSMGDLFKLATNLCDEYGTRVEVKIEHNKIVVVK